MEDMCYVAADPNQPESAWAITVDKPEHAKDTAKTIANWIRAGANVMRVERGEGIAILNQWERLIGEKT